MPFVYFFNKNIYFFQRKSIPWWFFDYCLPVKVICTQLLETCALSIRILLVFHMLIISLGKTFNCLRYHTSDTFFKHQQLVYVSKQLKAEPV